MVYYWNVRSNTTTWDPPPCWIEKDPEEGSSRWGEGEEDREEDMEVQRVMQGFEVDPPAATSCTTAAAAAAAASSTMMPTRLFVKDLAFIQKRVLKLKASVKVLESNRDDIRTRQEIYPDLKRCKNPFISQSVQHRPDESMTVGLRKETDRANASLKPAFRRSSQIKFDTNDIMHQSVNWEMERNREKRRKVELEAFLKTVNRLMGKRMESPQEHTEVPPRL